MDERTLLAALARLPDGVTEIYSHPATQDGITRSMASYRPTEELDALLIAARSRSHGRHTA